MPIAASLSGAELDQKSHTKIDAQGKLPSEHPGKAWMAINIGVSAGLGKVSDDTLQLIIEAIVSTATDVSTAGAGRIAASCVSGIFMVSRHGSDVVCPDSPKWRSHWTGRYRSASKRNQLRRSRRNTATDPAPRGIRPQSKN